MSLPVAILAGGLATRLRPITETIPKILVDVAGRPFGEHQIEILRTHGITRVVLCVGYLGEMVQAALGDGSRWGVELHYSFDGDKLLGTGGALRRALPLLGEAFFVMYGDSYLECPYEAIEDSFYASGKQGLMTVFRNENRWDRSNIIFRDGAIVRYDKKEQTLDMLYIDYGLGVLRADVLTPYPDDQPFDLSGVYQDLIQQGQLAGFEVPERFYEIGSHEGLEETRQHLARKR
jgi:N-acetyl-alpha-D-muramate 1-phosphate uridylyltransferase